MGRASTPRRLVALSLQCNIGDDRVVTIDRVDREVRVRSGAGSWPRESRSRVVKRGRIPLPWARSGYDLSMGRWRCTISPGQNGSHADRGDSIVLGCGHTWGPRMGGGVPGDLCRYEAGDCLLGGSVPHYRVGGGGARRWPPSAAQTGRAVVGIDPRRTRFRVRWLLHGFRRGPQSDSHGHVSSGPPTIPDGRFSRVRFWPRLCTPFSGNRSSQAVKGSSDGTHTPPMSMVHLPPRSDPRATAGSQH